MSTNVTRSNTTQPHDHHGPAARPRSRRSKLVAATISGLVLTTGAYVGISRVITDHYVESQEFATVADAPAHNGVFNLPAWVPADATDITMTAQTQGGGRTLVMSTAAAEASGCEPALKAPDRDPAVDLDLPGGVRESDGQRCDTWHIVHQGERTYAWTAYFPS